ncbi:hypothetical protein JZ751_011286, partial [Albula glossodonta]
MYVTFQSIYFLLQKKEKKKLKKGVSISVLLTNSGMEEESLKLIQLMKPCKIQNTRSQKWVARFKIHFFSSAACDVHKKKHVKTLIYSVMPPPPPHPHGKHD